tara:strand:+ start:255 stop:551 length:297 start_codon:yes stop_codon:yes gene_type:complete
MAVVVVDVRVAPIHLTEDLVDLVAAVLVVVIPQLVLLVVKLKTPMVAQPDMEMMVVMVLEDLLIKVVVAVVLAKLVKTQVPVDMEDNYHHHLEIQHKQ